jgi:hypothetical protein
LSAVSPSSSPTAELLGDATPSATRAGVVVEQFSSQPLGGVVVRWTVGDEKHADTGQELGRAITDGAGRFAISLAADPAAQKAYESLGCTPEARTWLSAAGANAVRDSGADATVMLSVSARKSAGPTRTQWASLAQALMANRSLDLHGLMGALSAAPAVPADAWPVATRAAALAAVHAAVGETNGSDAAILDFEALSRGKLVQAVSASQAQTVGELGPAGWYLPKLPKSDRELYRDYLRGVWDTAASQMYQQEADIFNGVPAGTLEAQLDRRFHQDFHTSDTALQSTAKLLMPILTSILTAAATREGFGLAAAAIPAQGPVTDDEFLATLVSLTEVSALELRNRFRISFVRRAGEQTTPVELNIEALLGLLRDTFQSQLEPFPALPAVEGNGRPLVFGRFLGHAPFFLEYEEWLERQRTFFPENAYDIRAVSPVFDDGFRGWVKRSTSDTVNSTGWFDDYPGERSKSTAWLAKLLPGADTLTDALKALDVQDYPGANAKLDAARQIFRDAIWDYDSRWIRTSFDYTWESTGVVTHEPVTLVQRASASVTNLEKLTTFEAFFQRSGPPDYPSDEFMDYWIAVGRTKMLYAAEWVMDVFIPYLSAQIAFTLGDYAGALRLLGNLSGYQAGIGQTTDGEPYDTSDLTATAALYTQSSLPYTEAITYNEAGDVVPASTTIRDDLLQEQNEQHVVLAPFEQRFFQLFQGEVMLALADTLYRLDTPDQIARARELYKGVVFMHGEDPEISPHFRAQPGLLVGSHEPYPFWRFTENPAKVSQLARARLGLFQISEGLNAYGYADDMAPVLRYKPLKDVADVFAQAAKSAQNDYLNYMTRLEQAQIELWQSQALVTKADAASRIATEQIAIAQDGVTKAQAQVAAVQQQIAAKQAEIADKDSFFSQASDYFAGVKDSLEGMVPLAGKVLAGDGGGAGGSVSLGDLAGIVSKTSSGGASAGEDAAAAALGSGAAFLVGYGAFVYASYQTMSSMADAANQRNASLATLENVTLGAAQAQVTLRQRDVTIAQQQQVIAQADLEYGHQLLRFQRDRFLGIELWNRLSLFANRLMRRYIDLGARTGWFAERALAFEQGRQIRIVKFDYWPVALRGLTGADSLLADLAELDANRLQGIRLTAPVKHTVSLAREFPLAFGQLKKTGKCRFTTDEATLHALYPGTYGYRLRAVTVAADNPDGMAPRGILRNGGISQVGAEDGTSAALARFPDALPLSEFRLRDDLFVYGLPGETLLQFEGSGYSTDWELELPVGPNPQGLRALADVLVSFDMNASWTAAPQPGPPPAKGGALVLAASVWDPKGLRAMRDATKAKALLTFDPSRLQLPRSAAKRTLTNLVVMFVGKTDSVYELDVKAQSTGENTTVSVTEGLAISNTGDLLGTAAPQPLNKLAGADLDQPFVLDLDKKAAANELAGMHDVVCWFEYQPPPSA